MYVVLYHFHTPLAFSNPISTFGAHGYLGVDIFFVLSGFVMAMNYGRIFETQWSSFEYLRFLGRRVARIYPLYLAATLVGFLEVVKQQPLTAQLGVTLASNILMVQVWGVGRSFDAACWSISAEWAAYIVFPLLVIPTLLLPRRWLWSCAVMCIMALTTFYLLPITFNNNQRPEAIFDVVKPAFGLPLVRCICEFMLGMIAFRASQSDAGRRFSSSQSIAVIVCAATLATMSIPRADLAVVLMLPLLIVSLSSEDHFPGRILASPPLEFIGTISYSIYLDHVFLHGRNLFLMLPHHFGLAHADLYATAGLFLLTFPISYVTYKLVEAPGRRWLRGLLERRFSKADGTLAASSTRVS